MSLTPLDVEKITFHSTFRGYAKTEVEQFLASVADALQDYLEHARRQDERITSLERELERYHQNEDLLKSSVLLAQKTCDELIAAAHKQADAIKREADLEGGDIRRQLTELRAEREQFEYAFHGLLTGFQRRLEQNNPQLRAQPQPSAELPAGSQPQPAMPVAPTPPTAPPPRRHVAPAPREEMFRQPHQPPLPSQPTTPSPAPPPETNTAEFDRDADIEDFNAALAEAPVPQKMTWPEPPSGQPTQFIEASSQHDPPTAESSPELDSSLAEEE